MKHWDAIFHSNKEENDGARATIKNLFHQQKKKKTNMHLLKS